MLASTAISPGWPLMVIFAGAALNIESGASLEAVEVLDELDVEEELLEVEVVSVVVVVEDDEEEDVELALRETEPAK